MNDIISDIYNVITEASLDVLEAVRDYENKQQFIQDVHDNVMISESFFNELKDPDQAIFTEAAVTENESVNNNEYRRYRFDFLNHTDIGAANNLRLTELIIGAFEASQKAKEAKGEPCNPLNNLLKRRTKNMQKIINKLYEGKDIAIYNLCRILDKYENSKSCFVKKSRIAGYNVAKHRNGDVGNNFINAEFVMKLPKQVLTKQNYEKCKYIEQINLLKKQQREIRKTSGTSDPRFHELASQIAEMYKNSPYGFDAKNDETVKELLNDTCFTSNDKDKVLKELLFGFHLIKRKDGSPDSIKALDYVNSKANQTEDFRMDEPNNINQIKALGKQFAFC